MSIAAILTSLFEKCTSLFKITTCEHLLWYPVFVPHINGEPCAPGEEILNESSRQCPAACAIPIQMKQEEDPFKTV